MVKSATKKDDDLLAEIGADNSDDVQDLLAGIDDSDDSTAWVPENAGEGVQGVVLSRSTTTSEYTPDSIPVLVLETSDGRKVRVTGFQSVLRREIEEADPQRGDTFACKYLGSRSTKDGKRTFHAYKVALRRGTGVRPAPTSQTPPPF